MDRYANPWRKTLTSKQQVVDCNIRSCQKGAFPPSVFHYVKDSVRCNARNYGYLNARGTCIVKKCEEDDNDNDDIDGKKAKYRQGMRIRDILESPKNKDGILKTLNKNGGGKQILYLFV